MTPKSLDQHAAELRNLVQEFLLQFRKVDSAATSNPNSELSLQEVRVLEYLGDRGMRMMRELAEFLVLAVNSVTNIIDNLERKAMVKRTRSDADRRVVLVDLTPEGKQIYNRFASQKQEFLQKLLSSLDPSEQDQFMLYMGRVVEAGRSTLGLKSIPTGIPIPEEVVSEG